MVLMGWQPMCKVSTGISLRASSSASSIPHNTSKLSEMKKQGQEEGDEGDRWKEAASQMLYEHRSLHNRAVFWRLGCKDEAGAGFTVHEPAHPLLPGSLKRAQYWQLGEEPCCWRDLTIWKLFLLWQITTLSVSFSMIWWNMSLWMFEVRIN